MERMDKIKKNKQEIIDRCNRESKGTLVEALGIIFIDVGIDSLTAKMPVTKSTIQPHGVLHGGASAALAETVGSYASFIFLNDENAIIRGLDITANHLKAVAEGYVFATAKKVHLGRTTQLWEIRITDEKGKLVAYCKHTTITLSNEKKG